MSPARRDGGAPPRKSLGQRFLTDRNILNAIADAAEVGPGDAVIEVGPGRGSLTNVLAERARHIVAVELDAALADALAESAPPNVRVVQRRCPRSRRAARRLRALQDARQSALLRRHADPADALESACPPSRMAILVQQEVAEQFCAKPGAMSLASLAVQRPRVARAGRFRAPLPLTRLW